MKIAFCLFKYFPYGGLQRDFIRIGQECLRRGHAVHVYTTSWDGPTQPGFSVSIIPAKGLQNHTKMKQFAIEFQKQTSQKKYDLKIGFNKLPGLDLYFAADTCFQAKVYQQKSFWYRLTPRYRNLLSLERSIFDQSAKTQIMTLTRQQQIEFMQYYQTPASRFHQLPPGISLDRMAPVDACSIRASLRKEFNIAENEFLLLFVGSGFKTKGLDRILKGIAALPPHLKNQTQLFIIGKDNPKPFQNLASMSRVKFLGGRDDITRFLLGADLLLHPAYNESAGMVLLEALASGLPVLTTDACGYAHYVHDSKGGIVLPSPFTQERFNSTLINMLSSPTDRASWQQNALFFTKNVDIYNMPQHAVNIIESLGQ